MNDPVITSAVEDVHRANRACIELREKIGLTPTEEKLSRLLQAALMETVACSPESMLIGAMLDPTARLRVLRTAAASFLAGLQALSDEQPQFTKEQSEEFLAAAAKARRERV